MRAVDVKRGGRTDSRNTKERAETEEATEEKTAGGGSYPKTGNQKSGTHKASDDSTQPSMDVKP